jgi:hypothetical protein
MARVIFRRYFGPDEADWDPRFDYATTGEEANLTMVRFTPETVVVRDQSYQPSQWARQQGSRRQQERPAQTATGDRRGIRASSGS